MSEWTSFTISQGCVEVGASETRVLLRCPMSSDDIPLAGCADPDRELGFRFLVRIQLKLILVTGVLVSWARRQQSCFLLSSTSYCFVLSFVLAVLRQVGRTTGRPNDPPDLPIGWFSNMSRKATYEVSTQAASCRLQKAKKQKAESRKPSGAASLAADMF